MDWSDEGIFLSAKPLGEANMVAELLTLGHGRHLGLVRGGRSRRMRPLLQPGNLIRVTWRARLAEHLGGFNVELMEPHARACSTTRGRSPRSLRSRVAGAALARTRPASALYAAALGVLRSLRPTPSFGPRFLCAGSSSSSAISASVSISPNAPRPAPMPILPMSRRALAAPCRAMRASLIAASCSSCRHFF